MGRFNNEWETQFSGRFSTILGAAQHRMTRGRQAQALPHLLGAQFVHGQSRGQHAAAGVGNFQAFEQALHAAVFTATAVQHNKGAVDFLAAQVLQQIGAHIDTEGINASGLQGFQHSGAGFQRHRALSALATEQHSDTAKGFRVEIGLQHGTHFDSPSANNGCLSNCGASPPISPAPWQRRMSPARSSGLTSGASSMPRSM